jgi:hypothetical protein
MQFQCLNFWSLPRQAHNNPVLIRGTAQEATKGWRSEGGEKREKKGGAAQETERIQYSQQDGTRVSWRRCLWCFIFLSFVFSVIMHVIHSPAPRCGTIASVAYMLWRVKQAANKLCWLGSMCKYNTQGSYNFNHCSGKRGSTLNSRCKG